MDIVRLGRQSARNVGEVKHGFELFYRLSRFVGLDISSNGPFLRTCSFNVRLHFVEIVAYFNRTFRRTCRFSEWVISSKEPFRRIDHFIERTFSSKRAITLISPNVQIMTKFSTMTHSTKRYILSNRTNLHYFTI